MSTRADYTLAEWRTLQFAPLWVFTKVAGADSQVDRQEMMALVTELEDAILFREPLVREVLTTVAEGYEQVMVHYKEDRRDPLVGMADVARVLAQKATADEADRFKRGLLLIGDNVAEASGRTLDRVSSEEKAALVAVARALGLSFP